MSNASSPFKCLPLHSLHKSLGATFQTFFTHYMPMHYDRIPSSLQRGVRSIAPTPSEVSIHCRRHAVIFDVSHMARFIIEDNEEKAKQMFSFKGELHPMHCKLSLWLNKSNNTIKDDLILCKLKSTNTHSSHMLITGNTNMTNIYERELLTNNSFIKKDPRQIMLAIQGPASRSILEQILAIELKHLRKMHAISNEDKKGSSPEHSLFISRTGYTGEDGFELITGNLTFAQDLYTKLVEKHDVWPAGLITRDQLRLEAGFGLSGQDFGSFTTPQMADYEWVLDNHEKNVKDTNIASFYKRTLFISTEWPAPLPRSKSIILLRKGNELVEIGQVTSANISTLFNKAHPTIIGLSLIDKAHLPPPELTNPDDLAKEWGQLFYEKRKESNDLYPIQLVRHHRSFLDLAQDMKIQQ